MRATFVKYCKGIQLVETHLLNNIQPRKAPMYGDHPRYIDHSQHQVSQLSSACEAIIPLRIQHDIEVANYFSPLHCKQRRYSQQFLVPHFAQ